MRIDSPLPRRALLALAMLLVCGAFAAGLQAEEPPSPPLPTEEVPKVEPPGETPVAAEAVPDTPGDSPAEPLGELEAAKPVAAPPSTQPSASSLSATTRARTRNAIISVRSFTPEQTLELIVGNLSELGGIVQSSTNGSAKIYVPDTALEEALATINTLGEVVVEDVSSEDVTLEIVTLQARIQELEASRQRVKGMLAKSSTVEDSLAVERDLQEVTQELESSQGRLNFLENRVASTPIELSVSMQARPQAETLRRGRPFEWVGSYGLDTVLP